MVKLLNRKCTIDGCGKKHHSRGFCLSHVRRLRKYGDALGRPELGFRKRRMVTSQNQKCAVEGCNRVHCGKSFCVSHFRRFQKYGTPMADIPLKVNKSDNLFHFCANPLCRKVIYSDGYKYGSGKYCDEQCAEEKRAWVSNRPKNIVVVDKTQTNVLPHKTLPINLIL